MSNPSTPTVPCAAGQGYVHFHPELAARCSICHPTRYYEVVSDYDGMVVGCVSSVNGDLSELVRFERTSSIKFFGEITQEQFQNYGDWPHEQPVSPPDRRFTVLTTPSLVPYHAD